MFRLDWAEKLDVALTYRPPEQKLVLVETKEGASIRLQVERADALACSFTQLRIEQRVDDLEVNVRSWADGIARRVTYLSEPLGIIELDSSGRAQLRSVPPDTQEKSVSYYDIILDARLGNRLMVIFSRKCYNKLEPRMAPPAVSCVLTLDILKRLVSDMETTWPNRPAAAEDSSEQWNPLV